ncbi:MAG: hypothetical protein LBD47_06950 [Treponema sp.]|nr:hypothetical protein [Treponema sp.]
MSKIYLTGYANWSANVISTDLSGEGRLKALETDPADGAYSTVIMTWRIARLRRYHLQWGRRLPII